MQPSEEYEGTAAFSEPEAQITRDAAKSLLVANGGPGLHAYVAIHAGIKELYVPYDYKLVVRHIHWITNIWTPVLND